MRKFIRRLWLKWKSRMWRSDDHMECITFLGPCNQCRDRHEAHGLDPDAIRPMVEFNANEINELYGGPAIL